MQSGCFVKVYFPGKQKQKENYTYFKLSSAELFTQNAKH